jgi:hypothetical protein
MATIKRKANWIEWFYGIFGIFTSFMMFVFMFLGDSTAVWEFFMVSISCWVLVGIEELLRYAKDIRDKVYEGN